MDTHKCNGGGYKPAPDVIEIRVRYYAERHFYRPLSRLRPEDRQAVVWCLHYHFQFSNGNIASLLSVSNRTIIRDIGDARFFVEKDKRFVDKVKELRAYILYNAQYIA